MARTQAKARNQNSAPKGRDSESWLRKGQKYDQAGDEKKAMQCYLESFNLDPKNMIALKALSRKLIKLTERRMAIEVLEQAVAANPGDPEVYLILGNLALEMRMCDAALKFFELTMQMKPDDPTGVNNVATALRELERFDEAIALLQEAITADPTVAALWNTLATIVSARDGIDAALPFFEEALRLEPKMSSALSNIARAYETCGRFEDSIEAGRKAIALDAELVEPHYVISTALLSLGRLEEGWKEYEWRQHWRRPTSLRFTMESERWDGSNLAGKTLVTCPEQGLGDELLFATCLSDIADKPEQLYIGCDKRLVPLYQRSFPSAKVGGYRDIFDNGQRYRDLPFLRESGVSPDYYIEVGSLPKFLRRSIEDFPKRTDGYLTPDPDRVAHWQEVFKTLGKGPVVGFGWRSSVITHSRSRHYTALDQWRDILSVPGVSFINLQHDDCEEELAKAERDFGVKIHRPEGINLKDDLDDLAALIKALDIVLAPAIAITCMSIAVGTELWLLARKAPWWHFGLNGPEDSSPLGHTRLFTYDEQGGWETPIHQAGKALKTRG